MEQEPFFLRPASPFGNDLNLAENPEPRVPCCLILDVSTSMEGEPIEQLNEALRYFKQDLESDSLAIKRVEVMMVTFGDRVEVLTDFQTVDQFYPPVLQASGSTPMGQAVNLAIERMEQRKEEYRRNGVAYYRPWLFLITDGEPDRNTGWEAVAMRAKQEDSKKSFAMFCIGVQGANMENLRKFSNREPLMLDGLKFRELFLWLSRSMKSVSRSNPGDQVPLTDPTGPKGWAVV